MKRRAVRLALFVLLAAVCVSAGVRLWQAELVARADRTAAAEFTALAESAQAAVAKARGALKATVAVGQSEDFWRTRTTRAIERARIDIVELKRRASNPDALNDLDAAAAELDAFAEAATQAARLFAADQRTQSSLVVFSDGLERAEGVAARIRTARESQASATALAVEARRNVELSAAMAIAVACLLVVGLLVPIGAGRAHVASVEIESGQGPSAADAVRPDAALDPLGVVDSAPPEARPAAPEPVAPPSPAQTIAADAPSRDRRKAPELRATADLCSDFARLLDSQELPALLERAARLIDASGLIVWVADPDTSALRPAIAYGYPPKAVERMPAIPRSADNATAAAYRHAELQVVKTNGMSPGALVVPLINASGCIGVVAAEVRHGRESSESARALARIIAAQLSGLVTVVPALERGMTHDRESALG
jgi:hypothetical protein